MACPEITTTEPTLADKARAFLGQFETAEEFRDYCAGQGIRAQRHCIRGCLVALALGRALGTATVVGTLTFSVLGLGWEFGPLPKPIQAAVDRFDAGEWPELEAT